MIQTQKNFALLRTYNDANSIIDSSTSGGSIRARCNFHMGSLTPALPGQGRWGSWGFGGEGLGGGVRG